MAGWVLWSARPTVFSLDQGLRRHHTMRVGFVFCLLKEYLLSTTGSTLGVRDPREKHCLCERQTATERENFFQLKIWFRRSPRFSWREYEVRNKPKLLIYPSVLIVGHSTRPIPSTS